MLMHDRGREATGGGHDLLVVAACGIVGWALITAAATIFCRPAGQWMLEQTQDTGLNSAQPRRRK